MATNLNTRVILIPSDQSDLKETPAYINFLAQVQGFASQGIVLIDSAQATNGRGFFRLTLAASGANDASIVALIAPLQASLGIGTIFTYEFVAAFGG